MYLNNYLVHNLRSIAFQIDIFLLILVNIFFNFNFRLKESSYQVWTDIRWKDLATQFPDGLTHRFLYIVCRRVVCTIPDYLKLPLSDVAENALQKLSNMKYRKLRLKRLCLNEDGELVKISSTD